MKFTKLALIASTAVAVAAPAWAQTRQVETSAQRRERQAAEARAQEGQAQQSQAAAGQAGQQQGRQLTLSRAERAALAPIEAPLRAQDWAAVQAALPAAQAAAQGEDARYYVNRAAFLAARGTNNTAAELQAITAMLALPNVPANERAVFLNRQAELAFAANDFAGAERAYLALQQLTPNDTRIVTNLSIVRQRLGNSAGALESLQQAIRLAEANGGRAEESAYRRVLQAAMQSRNAQQIAQASTQLITAYPNGANWRSGLVLLRQNGGLDGQGSLDIYRLQRAASALEGEADYLLFAQELNRGGLVGEAKAVLDEGVRRNQISASNQFVRDLSNAAGGRIAQDRAALAGQQRQAQAAANGRQARGVADALFGYGQYAEAAAMYRVALQKGGEDANLLNTRLGAALAMAGQRAEAEAALRSVTGPRQALANYWLLYLNRRAAA